jgi:lipopolysaccharide biosynthesis regulator YciM
MCVRLNLYAHQRFPHNLTFVRNLLEAYRARPSYNRQAWDALIRQYWFYDDNLRSIFFVYLTSGGGLDAELQALRAAYPQAASGKWSELVQANPAAAEFVTEAEIWRSHFEAAAPVSRAIAQAFPADFEMGRRASSLFRSLASFHPEYTEAAAALEESLSKANPANRDILIRMGDIYADREQFAKARPYWDRVPGLEPGNPDAYLASATVFWDYFLYDDTLRVIHDARRKFSDPALFAYQAGAVYEGRRDLSRAVGEYLSGALGATGDPAARARLLRLVRRPNLSANIERATARAASSANPDWNAVSLCADVLSVLDRRADLETFLTHLAGSTSSLELLQQIEPLADRYGFDNLRILILQRQIALLPDPVEKLQSRLQLARFYESKNQMEQARALMESIYSDNPLRLGVVRAVVDFYWRHKLWDPALATLAKAVQYAYPDLRAQLSFEAVSKAMEVNEYARARALLGPLLQAQPYNAQYLAAMADSFARQGDDKSLRGFYLDRIQSFRDANLPAEEKTERIAALRRGLIPALARLQDFAGAVDQYIEILNRYPEDAGLVQDAAAFAERHGRAKQLLDYYSQAASDSPQDFRWPMLRARIETYLEDYPAAIASYVRARTVRPDRADLLAAQASLEERLMRFDDALKSCSRLYDLTYQNPAWMEKAAELEARQGRGEAAVAALRKALIEGRPERPELYYSAAARLAGWNMLEAARQFAARGVALAGKDVLLQPVDFQGLITYVTILTRLRDYRAAYAQLREAAAAARGEKVTPDLTPFLSALGRAVRDYYTPEETAAFAGFLRKQRGGMGTDDFIEALLPLAQYAELADLEASWRYEVMMASPGTPQAQAMETRLAELQKQRLRFNEYGAQLEAYWNVFPPKPERGFILQQAAASYRAIGNSAAELRVLHEALEERLYGEPLSRYLELLSRVSPEQLVTLAGGAYADQVRDAAAQAALATGNAGLARRAIAARGSLLPPVWTRAYTGLAGLYYLDDSPAVNTAFEKALDTRSIGERLASPPARDEALAGNLWFYYGSRYGEYLSLTHVGDPEAYLPARLEAAPANADAYCDLADSYRGAGQLDAALADYAHVLEISDRRADAHDRRAQILWQQGKQEDAVKEWRAALEASRLQEDARPIPPAFWADLPAILEHIGERKLLPQLRSPADAVVRAYVRRNGAYSAERIIEGVLAAAGDPNAGTAWLLDLARSAPSPLDFVSQFVHARWLPESQRESLYRVVLTLAQDQAAKTFGAEHATALANLGDWQIRYINFLLDHRRTADAQTGFDNLAEEMRDPHQPEIAGLMIRLAAQSGKLAELFSQFDQHPEQAPALDLLRNAASGLLERDPAGARLLLEYVYTRQIAAHDFEPAAFLGLAEIRLQQGNLTQAVALLERLNRVAGQPFENLASAGVLLVKMGHPSEAIEFCAQLVKAVPWDNGARLKLAQAEAGANMRRNEAAALFVALASGSSAAYAERASAAAALADLKASAPSLGSAELDWLSHGAPPAAAEAHGFFYARLRAARENPEPAAKIRLLLDAIALRPSIDPEDPPPAPRLLLASAAAAANQNALAASAIEPLLDSSVKFGRARPWRDRRAVAEENELTEYPASLWQSFLTGQGLDAGQRAQFAADLAQVMVKLDRLAEAARYWKVASMLAPNEPLHSEASREYAHVQDGLSLERADQERRPVIANALTQPGTVRPRLLGRSGASSGAGAGGGTGQ